MDYEHVPAPATGRYKADELVLYGVKLNANDDYGRFDIGEGHSTELRVQLFKDGGGLKAGDHSIVLAYGYAFDGHCYRLDSHRIFIVTGPKAEAAVGCGFDSIAGASYQMWRIRASTELIEIATSFGDAQTLILDANLPGKRSPTSYAITQSMAHRDRRLNRD
ncbi:hypothetical protein [Ensifer adhaerens]|uniref:hypothetical protein n=1 Tax=Ensifer adhaerens TaxID=106592 RepID=UPI00109DD062|nr:hypothetical protein [Ensifer adhaerens]THA64350.1 hypothetical protein E5176_17465 [Ensifer adhaerens]